MKNNKGFTLLEVLLAFSTFLVITSFIPQIIKLISFEPKLNHHLEVSLFFQQLALDVQNASTIAVSNNTLFLQFPKNQQVSYSLFQRRIRRQINNQGQEVALQNVSTIKFTKWQNGIDIDVLDIYNQTHSKRITHYLPLEVR